MTPDILAVDVGTSGARSSELQPDLVQRSSATRVRVNVWADRGRPMTRPGGRRSGSLRGSSAAPSPSVGVPLSVGDHARTDPMTIQRNRAGPAILFLRWSLPRQRRRRGVRRRGPSSAGPPTCRSPVGPSLREHALVHDNHLEVSVPPRTGHADAYLVERLTGESAIDPLDDMSNRPLCRPRARPTWNAASSPAARIDEQRLPALIRAPMQPATVRGWLISWATP